MTLQESVLMDQLISTANGLFDGHLTILKFTTNWRVGFITPEDRDIIQRMAEGPTFAEAARRALKLVSQAEHDRLIKEI